MLYPMKLDLVRGRVFQVEMDEAAFRSASFLDERMLTPHIRGDWMPLAQILEASQDRIGAIPLHFIFHTGHVGSTLVSRLIDETGRVLSLREPLPLRTLAAAGDALRSSPSGPLTPEQFEALVAAFVRLWQRGFDRTEAIILKATSSAARLAPTLLKIASGSRAIYLNLRPEPWLATLLAGEQSSVDLRGHAPERMSRLSGYVDSVIPDLEALSAGELAAVSWLTETITQVELLAACADRVLPIDFDAFLANVPAFLHRILGHFGLSQDAQFLAQVMRSPVLQRYSKAPEHPYDPMLRQELIAESRQRNREEILRGMRLLERMVRNEPRIAALLAAR